MKVSFLEITKRIFKYRYQRVKAHALKDEGILKQLL